MKVLKLNEKGQGLIEYLILVALVAVASIGIVKSIQVATNTQFANIVNALRGTGRKQAIQEPSESLYKKSQDLSEFMKNANDNETQKK